MITMLYWEPGKVPAKASKVADVAEIETLADDLLSRYHSAGVLPGIELRASSGDTLSIAVSPDGWALVHTDTQFTQHCTYRPEGDKGSADVRWEEVTSVPKDWFIPKALALAGIKQWLADGTRSPDLPWSDQCA